MHESPDVAKNEAQIVVRVPGDAPDRAERLAERIAKVPAFAGVRVTKSTVLRMALLRGLEALEAEHGVEEGGSDGR